MFCSILTCVLLAMQGLLIHVETTLTSGLPYFNIVGLPDSSVRESKERIRSALQSCGLSLPQRRITVNLAPANLKKEGSALDFPIAVSLLASQGLLPSAPGSLLSESMLLGELSLNGDLSPVPGCLIMACTARSLGIRRIIIPMANTYEASFIDGIEIIGIRNLSEAIEYLTGNLHPEPIPHHRFSDSPPSLRPLQLLQGQPFAVRALTISAAGWHPLLLWGPPGTGKTTAANALISLLPSPSQDEYLEIASIYSSLGESLPASRPFRAPHHTIPAPALVGGGIPVRPGEITMAHRGVLFLDEFPEFSRTALETFREPLENHQIQISRVHQTVLFPAHFLFVASMNPCPCGYYPDRSRCKCTAIQISRYLSRIQGPLLDRIDLSIHLSAPSLNELSSLSEEEALACREKVRHALAIQNDRYRNLSIRSNSELQPDQIRKYCELSEENIAFLKKAYSHYSLSMRGYLSILKTARTIADLDSSEKITSAHLQEALAMRSNEVLQHIL